MSQDVWIALGSFGLAIVSSGAGLVSYLLRVIREGDVENARAREKTLMELRASMASIYASQVELARLEERLAAITTALDDNRRLTMEVLSILRRRRPDSR